MNSQKKVLKKERQHELGSIQEILQFYNPSDVVKYLRSAQENYANCYIQIMQHVINNGEDPEWFEGTLVEATRELSFLKTLADSFDKVVERKVLNSDN